MKRNIILTESQLQRIIDESIRYNMIQEGLLGGLGNALGAMGNPLGAIGNAASSIFGGNNNSQGNGINPQDAESAIKTYNQILNDIKSLEKIDGDRSKQIQNLCEEGVKQMTDIVNQAKENQNQTQNQNQQMQSMDSTTNGDATPDASGGER